MYPVDLRAIRSFITLAILMGIATSTALRADGQENWTPDGPRPEVMPAFSNNPHGGVGGGQAWLIRADARPGLQGHWSRSFAVEGGKTYRFEGYRKVKNLSAPRRSVYARILWKDFEGKYPLRDEPAVGPYHDASKPVETTAEFPTDRETIADGWTKLAGVYRAPKSAVSATVELHLDAGDSAEVAWSGVSLRRTDEPVGRKARLATVHFAPSGRVSPADNCRQFAPLIAKAAAEKADLVVLPETLTQTGTGKRYADVAEPIPGPSTDYFGGLARKHNLYLVVGLVERAAHVVYNTAVLIGPDGAIVGKYRKVCLPRTEVEQGITPGTDYPVFPTRFGTVGMMVCYDGFFPEVARELSNRGAEVIAFPVAGCNPLLVAARACENHAYIVSSTYTDVSQHWTISAIIGHQGEVLAQATAWGTVAVAEVDLDRPTIWAGIGDFKAQLLRHRPLSAAELKEATPPPPLAPAKPASLRIAPKEPAEAAKSFRVLDGFRLDLLAAEPLVTSPVAIEYDEDGRAYVVEMCDYPYTDKAKDKPFTEHTADLPLGRVRLLEDTDGDGRFDRSTIYADGLSWPTGLALWKGGVYVAGTPEIVYLKDTDGDRRADIRRTVFSGFSKFNVQAVVNNLRWGLDHRIHGAGGSNGGTIRHGTGAEATKPLKMAAQDFHFDPLKEELELVSGGARFGQSFDDWGNRFICNIRNPIRHAVIDDRYLNRNPLLAVASPLSDVAEAGDTLPIYRLSPPEPWRLLNARRLAADPANISPRSETVAAGFVTSACGLTLYRGAAYPSAFYGQAFLGEVAANVIHRQRLRPDGLTFTGQRIDVQAEFVASTDNWFRPVNFTNAPDGTLHVLDMYRETIEHPWSIPDDIKEQLDLESGRDRGRIYRLTPPGFVPPKPPRLGSAGVTELIAALANPNSWWRETAHRLIFERHDPAFVAPLRSLLRTRASDPPTGAQVASLSRLHALWSLKGLGALEEADLHVALDDPSPGVREHAIRLAESTLATAPALLERVLALASDPSLRVRGQAALSLGDLGDDRVTQALAEVARRDPDDPWIRVAVLSAKPDRSVELLDSLCRTSEAPEATVRLLATFVGARGFDDEVRRTLKLTGHDASKRIRREVVLGLSEGLSKRNLTLASLAERVEPEASVWIDQLVAEASPLAADAKATTLERVQAVTLLGLGPFAPAQKILVGLLDPTNPREVQIAAVQALARQLRPEVPDALLGAARGATPAVKTEVIHQLLSRGEWLGALLDAVEARKLAASEIPLSRRALLLRNPDPAIKARATRLFARESPAERGAVVERYRSALGLAADDSRGQMVARKVCLNCHRLAGEGNDVGPALESIRHRAPEEVLLHVLDPNREVSPNYLEYVVERKDGRVTSGVIAAETATSVTLKREAGQGETILRDDIASLASTGKSVMPEGMENQITLQDMADLLAFLLKSTPVAERPR